MIQSDRRGETYLKRELFQATQGFHAAWRKGGIGGADGRHGGNATTERDESAGDRGEAISG